MQGEPGTRATTAAVVAQQRHHPNASWDASCTWQPTASPAPQGNFKMLLSKARAKDAVRARATKTKQGRAVARCAPMATTSPKPTWTACTSSLCSAIPALLASMGQGTTKANARLVLQGSSKMLPGRPGAKTALLVGSAGTWHTREATAQRARSVPVGSPRAQLGKGRALSAQWVSSAAPQYGRTSRTTSSVGARWAARNSRPWQARKLRASLK